MKIRMLVDSRVFFAKGSEVEVTEGEAKRLLSLGFAKEAEEPVKEVKTEEVKEEPVKEVKKSNSKKK